MVDLDSSQIVLKRFHLQQVHQNADLKEFTSRTFNYNPVGYKTSHVSQHSFIVDWQIPESENDEKRHEFLPT
jgi:hypothetical protein